MDLPLARRSDDCHRRRAGAHRCRLSSSMSEHEKELELDQLRSIAQ
jgi:hypothetical protein